MAIHGTGCHGGSGIAVVLDMTWINDELMAWDAKTKGECRPIQLRHLEASLRRAMAHAIRRTSQEICWDYGGLEFDVIGVDSAEEWADLVEAGELEP